MTGKLVLALLVLLCVGFASVEAKKVPRSLAELRRVVLDEEDYAIDTEDSRERAEKRAVVYPPYQTFNQTLDHFNWVDTRTFSQRYVVNDTFWDGKGPIFLMIGGESALSRNYVYGFQMAYWAAEFNALAVAIEHRFYGQSQPFADLSIASLSYYSADQVLADTATFVDVLKKQYNAKDSQVIVFGGSYAGMLASWFRIKYPQIAYAAVSSSGTVEAIANYYHYLEVVTAGVNAVSPKCARNIAAATAVIQPLTQTTAGLAQLSQMFDTCPAMIPADIPNFMQYLAYWWMYATQYNYQGASSNVTYLCEIMTQPGKTPLENYLQVWNYYKGDSCIDVSLGSYIASINDTTALGGTTRQFWYMICFFQGFFQTSDSNKQVFGNLFPLASLTQNCPLGFEGREFNPASIYWTNLNFGGNDPEVSRVIYVNGDRDGWYPSSILSTPRYADYKTIVIKGGSHCIDMKPAQPHYPPGVKHAQEKIRCEIRDWIRTYNREHRKHW